MPERKSQRTGERAGLAREGLRAATISIGVCALLSLSKIITGLIGHSAAAIADGVESGLDMVSSLVLIGGLAWSLRPADPDHPYGHERAENVSALALATLLLVAGVSVGAGALSTMSGRHMTPELFTIWPLVISMASKGWLAIWKTRISRRSGSTAMRTDAFNDAIDVLSALTATGGILLSRYDPSRFLLADNIAGVLVALIIITGGLRLLRQSISELMDEAPESRLLSRIRATAARYPGVLSVHNCRGRRVGAGYLMDIHVRVDPRTPVIQAHKIAHGVKEELMSRFSTIRDVLTHVEPAPGERSRKLKVKS